MTATEIPQGWHDMVAPMRADHERIERALAERGLGVDAWPELPNANPEGCAAAQAYPIQGVLKYHGMADWRWRTAYLPSISVNNDAARTLTHVRFDPDRANDRAVINGAEAHGRELDRVSGLLDVLREMAGVASRAVVTTRNIVRAQRVGKGLGTSASASAALAKAAIAALWGDQTAANRRLASCTARLLAGSGCRSAVGGLSLWMSYPGIPHREGYAVRLDQADELADMALVTVPIDSRIGLRTELAHAEAPRSPFFRPWMRSRADEIVECLDAAQAGDWRTIGQLSELDSVRLHGVTMSASRDNKLFAWEPENVHLFRLCNELRDEGHPVYFSTDTGPTTVFVTHQRHVDRLVEGIASLRLNLEAVVGKLGGPAELVDADDALRVLTEKNSR